MNPSQGVLAVGTVLAAAGLWLLLPRGNERGRMLGGVLVIAALGCYGAQIPAVGDWFAKGMFHAIALVTVVGAVATISFRSPVYCAIWFGLTLSGTAGLFLLAGAEFLAISTIVVYAGAILVTFLFVLMLSEPEGYTTYDRRSWEAMIAAPTGAVLVGILTMTIAASISMAAQTDTTHASLEKSPSAAKNAIAADAVATPTVPPPTISELGAQLFTRYLISVEAAGVLLFAALVGAAALVTQGGVGRSRTAAATSSGPREGAAHAS